MVDVNFLGDYCFRISGKHTVLLFNPSKSLDAKKQANVQADVVLLTDNDGYKLDGIDPSKNDSKPFIISGPGEYEIAKSTIVGMFAPDSDDAKIGESKRIIIYQAEVDGLTFAYLGRLGKKLNQQQLEVFGGVDVLLIPVGGQAVLDAKEAIEVVAQIEPKIVVPIQTSYTTGTSTNTATDQFLSQIGKEKMVQASKLSLSKDRLPEEMQVVVLAKS